MYRANIPQIADVKRTVNRIIAPADRSPVLKQFRKRSLAQLANARGHGRGKDARRPGKRKRGKVSVYRFLDSADPSWKGSCPARSFFSSTSAKAREEAERRNKRTPACTSVMRRVPRVRLERTTPPVSRADEKGRRGGRPFSRSRARGCELRKEGTGVPN